MLEHIPRLPKARPTRLPVLVFLILLTIPVGLSVLHGYKSTRLDHQLAMSGPDSEHEEQRMRDRLSFLAEEQNTPVSRTDTESTYKKRDKTPYAAFKRWLNLAG